MENAILRTKVIDSLLKQGFYVNGHVMPALHGKENYRDIHDFSRKEQILANKDFLLKNIELVKRYFPNPEQLEPSKITLEIREVKDGSVEHSLYRWWNLVWWSMPFQRAYGRQMRFLLWDTYHDCPFGIIGLQSPILKMSVRDQFLKIPKEKLDLIVNQSMQAQRLGALPPYNSFIGGKLVSLALTSNELRNFYTKKYFNSITILKERVIEPELLFITTTSAYGKSSIYNRLKYNEEKVAISLGYTKGSGTFHITNEIYKDIQSFLHENNINTNTTFGFGASRKMKLIDKALGMLKLDSYHYHNIKREYFLFPIAKNLENIIKKDEKPVFIDRQLAHLTDYWKSRWALKRIETDKSYKNFNIDNLIMQLNKDLNNI